MMTRVSRGDKTAIELFCLGLTGWDVGLREGLADRKRLLINLL
jgi:hypothetical protein